MLVSEGLVALCTKLAHDPLTPVPPRDRQHPTRQSQPPTCTADCCYCSARYESFAEQRRLSHSALRLLDAVGPSVAADDRTSQAVTTTCGLSSRRHRDSGTSCLTRTSSGGSSFSSLPQDWAHHWGLAADDPKSSASPLGNALAAALQPSPFAKNPQEGIAPTLQRVPSAATRQQRLQMLVKRKCLAEAAAKIVARLVDTPSPAAWVEPDVAIFNVPAQCSISLERFILRLLASTAIMSPTSFLVALHYVVSCARPRPNAAGAPLLRLSAANCQMTMLAAATVAAKAHEDFQCRDVVKAFASAGLCSATQLAAAECALLEVLWKSPHSLVPTEADLRVELLPSLLSASKPCAHDITCGRHCWMDLLPLNMQHDDREGSTPTVGACADRSPNAISFDETLFPPFL